MPHRLIRSTLRRAIDGMDGRQGLRFRIVTRTPTVFIDYLPEMILGFIAILSGIAILLGLSTSRTAAELPHWLRLAWGAVLVLGSLTVLVGMLTRRYGTTVASGMRLIGAACLVYVVVLVAYAGFGVALFAILTGGGIGFLALWRAFLLRTTYMVMSEKSRRETRS